MRNRAKCKLCEDIIESMYTHDYQMCKCGEIAVDGGKDYHRVLAKDWANFLRIDDDGNVIIPTIRNNEEKCGDESVEKKAESEPAKRSKKDLIWELDEMINGFKRLPPGALAQPVDHSDWVSLLSFLSRFFKAED